ncbi:F0F1 ATP synthase subunit B [Spirulina subsalsa]|uniref:F0F1 ATP synthase subunit B n=1 Tax=Spirulina subsalsa TaxID=54311 RepID=UPI00032005F8|nr:F0F1 ATP synthase subunit B [Spirulina subsalsa]
MGIVFYLATEGAERGFGLNFDILETNLFNLVIIIAVLFYFGRQFLGTILSQRQARISEAIQEAEQRVTTAATQLAEAQQNLAQAQDEAKKIRANAEATAGRLKTEILAKGEAEIARIRETAAADLSTEQDRAIAELRQRVATLALAKVEAHLKDHLDDSIQGELIDRSIARIGG